MRPTYIALVHKEPDSDYGVSFPDLPGCVTAGRTLDEAQRFAAEALSLHLDGLADEGLEVPGARDLDAIAALEESHGATLLAVEAAKERRQRINITFPGELLAAVDRKARELGVSRSEFLVRSARERLREEAS